MSWYREDNRMMAQTKNQGIRTMIDVSTFLLGDRCPRCVQRRVYAIDPERNLWMCVPNAMPVAMKEHVIEHDAAEWSEDYSPAEREANAGKLMETLYGRR